MHFCFVCGRICDCGSPTAFDCAGCEDCYFDDIDGEDEDDYDPFYSYKDEEHFLDDDYDDEDEYR